MIDKNKWFKGAIMYDPKGDRIVQVVEVMLQKDLQLGTGVIYDGADMGLLNIFPESTKGIVIWQLLGSIHE